METVFRQFLGISGEVRVVDTSTRVVESAVGRDGRIGAYLGVADADIGTTHDNIYKEREDLIIYMILGKKMRVRSEVAELGYISPWKPQQESSRNNDLEAFLTKNNSPRIDGETKFRLARTEPLTGHHPKGKQTPSKKTTRTELHPNTITDFRMSLQRTFNRKFYSRSASLHASRFYRSDQSPPAYNEEPIFAKRCRQSKKPKLVTLGGQAQNISDKQPMPQEQEIWNKERRETRAVRRKKEFMLKKQSLTQEMLKGEIANHKDFIASLEGCLAGMKRGESEGSAMLASTVKNFLTHHYKKL